MIMRDTDMIHGVNLLIMLFCFEFMFSHLSYHELFSSLCKVDLVRLGC